jgi:hypothetical protein
MRGRRKCDSNRHGSMPLAALVTRGAYLARWVMMQLALAAIESSAAELTGGSSSGIEPRGRASMGQRGTYMHTCTGHRRTHGHERERCLVVSSCLSLVWQLTWLCSASRYLLPLLPARRRSCGSEREITPASRALLLDLHLHAVCVLSRSSLSRAAGSAWMSEGAAADSAARPRASCTPSCRHKSKQSIT